MSLYYKKITSTERWRTRTHKACQYGSEAGSRQPRSEPLSLVPSKCELLFLAARASTIARLFPFR